MKDSAQLRLEYANFVGEGQAVVAQNSTSPEMTRCSISTSGPAPALALSRSPGTKISGCNFVEFRLADEFVLPRSRPFVLIEGGGDTSQGTPDAVVIDGCHFEHSSPFTKEPCILVQDLPGQSSQPVTMRDCTYVVASRTDTCLDLGGDGWTSNDPNVPGGPDFPEGIVATQTAEGTKVAGKIDLPTGKRGAL